MVDWYCIFFVLWWVVYPSPQSIYNVGSNATLAYLFIQEHHLRQHIDLPAMS